METEYYRLCLDNNVADPIKPQKLNGEMYCYKMNQKAFQRLDDLVVAYYTDIIGLEICDFLIWPTFMMTTRFRDLFELLAPEIQFKGVQLYPINLSLELPMPMYWIPYIEETDCMHPSSCVYGTGIVKTLVLRESAVAGKHIIKVKGIVEEIWLASLSAAESILRRRPQGLLLEPVKVREA